MRKIYVGCNLQCYEVFRSECVPTAESHGHRYFAAIGPFRTMRGAKFMADHGRGNPHLQDVAAAEKIAKRAVKP